MSVDKRTVSFSSSLLDEQSAWGFTAFLLLVALTGCTTTSHIQSGSTSTDAATDVNEQSRDQNATLTLTTGAAEPAQQILVQPDSVRWVHAKTSAHHVTARECVETIRFDRPVNGFFQGLGIGTGAGLLAGGGTILGLEAAGQCEGYAALGCGLIGIGLFTVGSVSGAIAGAVRGHQDVYVVEPTASGSCTRAPGMP